MDEPRTIRPSLFQVRSSPNSAVRLLRARNGDLRGSSIFECGRPFNVTRHHQVLCGKEPYGGQNLGRLLSSKIINDVRPIEPDDKAALGFTDGLWWTVKCCWLKDRDVRPDVKTILSRLDYAAWAWDMRRSPRIPS